MKKTIKINTKGNTDIINITEKVNDILNKSKIKSGIINLFVKGSTLALTTIEYEPGLIKDLKEAFEHIAPENKDYYHNLKWGDGNGFSHIRASLLRPDLTIPFENNKLLLGIWQQIVLIDFDNRPREREIIIKKIS
ncbi:MAG: secondary thiamine-phosphate synthase enzyme YjbQ [Nanoarchaeota archaeon]|nr:secondary thiamine-phosphate synthase enzyme YjbQ [Nanoarchaeota archaeon]